MKTKKKLGFFAAALMALVCALPCASHAAGDIWSIEPYQDEETVQYDFTKMKESPLKAGDVFKIKIRLLNNNWAGAIQDATVKNQWAFKFVGSGDATFAQQYMPELGLWVNGRLAYAELDGTPTIATGSDTSDKSVFTDMIFKYTVQAGDLALPIKLANPAGTGPIDLDQEISGEYFLHFGRGAAKNEDWALFDAATGAVQASLTFCDIGNVTAIQQSTGCSTPKRKWDFSDPGIYVQAIDFDDNYADQDAGVWRTVASGTTSASPVDPMLAIPGGAGSTMDLYVWTEKSSVAKVVVGGDVTEVKEYTDTVSSPSKTYLVGKIRIQANETSPSFKLEGQDGQAGQTTCVFLAPTPTNVYDRSETLLTNFIMRTVKVVTPPPPYVSVSLAEGAASSVKADADYAEHKTVLKVTLSQTFTEAVEVTVTPRLVNPVAGVDAWNYIGLSNYDEGTDSGAYLARTKKVVIPAGSKQADLPNLYLYALGADVNTSALTNGIVFEASLENASAAARAFYTGTFVSTTIHINEGQPVVTMPDADYTEIQGGETVNFNVGVGDSFLGLQGSYDVYWSESGSASAYKKVASDVTPTGGVIVVAHKYLTTGDNIQSKVYVISQDGRKSNECSFKIVKVASPRRIYATFVEHDNGVYGEGETATIKIHLEPAFNLGEEAYVFIQPHTADGSNYVSSQYFEQKGTRIKFNDSVAAINPTLDVLDGCNKSEAGLDYSLVIRSENSLTTGYEIDGYGSDSFTLIATNIVPSVNVAKMGIWEVENNGTVEGTASVGVSKSFSLTPNDDEVDADFEAGLDTDGKVVDQTSAFLAKWTFYDGAGFSTNVWGSPYQEVPYTFVNAGKIKVQVELQDKDLRKKGETKFGPKFTFYVNVIDTPAVELSPKYGSTTFLESETDAPINITLTEPAAVPIDVKVVVSRVGGDDGNYPLPQLSATPWPDEPNAYKITFPKGKTELSFNLRQLDGTDGTSSSGDGIQITATVVTDTENSDGIKYSELYLPTENFVIHIDNVAPEVIMPDAADTNVYVTTLAKQEVINWRVKDDCKIDMTNEYHQAGWGGGLKVTVMNSEGAYEIFWTRTGSGAYTNTFTAAGGGKWVSVQVEDKDGKQSQVVKKYFEIAASKGVYIFPQRPYRGGGQSELSTAYLSADGVGSGRVWAETDSVPAIKSFRHLWSYSEGNSTAIIGAYGYRPGDVDNGKLNGEKGVGITADGVNLKDGLTPYTFTGKYDNFLYAWVIDTADESSTYTGTATLSPQLGFDPVEKIFGLPEDEDDAESYIDTVVEAIFSREYRLADNMGDINQDGIPDVFAVRKWDAGILYQQAGQDSGGSSDSGDGSSSVDVSDLKSAWSYNGDADMLPQAFKYPNPLKPTKPGWGPDQDFKAGWEIRGFHEGLNYAGISDPDFSEAETMALFCDYLKAGNEKKDTYEDMFVAATNWAKQTSWNLERMTDPTKADTDDDGYDDGYEYFFWYYAKAGTMVAGKWTRLTGSRFNLAHPGQGDLIPSEQIAAAFDPRAKHPEVQDNSLGWDVKDFDGDGLTDLEEYTLGTNPVDWDSDGDGASDYFEVLNGTDPLLNDPLQDNQDGDFMAYMTSTDAYTVVRVWDDEEERERVFAYPVEEGGIEIAGAMVPGAGDDDEPTADEKEVWKTTVLLDGVETVCYLDEQPVLLADAYGSLYLGKSATGYKAILVGEGDGASAYLGEEIELAEGAQVKDAAEAAEKVSTAVTSGFAGGLELFRYGSAEDGVWVPRAADGQTMVEFVDGDGNPTTRDLTVLEYIESSEIVYLHHQVYQMAGFDPRTGWFDDKMGYVAARWHVLDSEKEGTEGETGLAVNTKEYTDRDEFLLLSYRFFVNTITNKSGEIIQARAHRDLDEDLGKIDAMALTMNEYLLSYATKSTPVIESSSTDGESTNTVTTAESTVHGADTDVDGIPDGWELYVNLDPNWDEDGAWVDDPLADTDNLLSVEEFAGTDSCNAYKDVPSIYTNHPGVVKGWYNKFFPTDPMDKDTDGDGLTDKEEGTSWTGTFYVGRESVSTTFTFVYGSNTTYETDMTTKCFRGGGMNPCTVDTDQDLLPDPWEMEFAGILMDATGKNAALSENALALLRRGDGLADGATPNGVYLSGGMDATWAGDAYGRVSDSMTGTTRDTDWDHDGLQNYQEYLVQSLRHLRYDDAETPLMGRYLVWKVMMGAPLGIDPKVPFMGFTPMQAWDGESFFKTCLEAGYKGNNTTFNYSQMGYFARPPKAWDRLACNTSGKNRCANYAEPGYRIMLRPMGLAEGSGPDAEMSSVMRYIATGYASTDPRRWDSDDDGMDDYYELFHGLNPLLGSNADPLDGSLTASTQGGASNGSISNMKYDRIAMIYNGNITSWKNAWTFWTVNGTKAPEFDAIKYPWMMGTAECDADGDGLRNSEEALTANLTAPTTTHTDPTPLWFTDSTSTNLASYVAQYYQFDPKWGDAADLRSCWDRSSVMISGAQDGYTAKWMFAFEENEGYDTDHDFIKDSDELVKRVTPASDPLAFTDPDRRQAMWFPGEKSAVVSTLGTQQRPNALEYDMLRQFTVEAWIRPERLGVEQVILERVSNYSGSTLSNAADVVRANFRLGLNADNCVFGEFEGSTADSGNVRVVGQPVEADAWTHVALTFNGSELCLYMNGDSAPVAKASNVGLIPANGVTIMLEESSGGSFPVIKNGYATVPSAILLGATALTGDAIELSAKSTWENYGKMFAGYVDEVRVWDGARTGTEINEAYKLRYSLDDVKTIRQTVYERWLDGARRNNATSVKGILPCELLQHYSFQALPGEIDPLDALTEPAGFTKNVLDNVRVNGSLVDLRCGWWASVPVHSTVYDTYAIVPWIQNTVAHLPALDGTVLDSVYWTEDYAGVSPASESGVSSFTFPNTANPYPYWTYFKERVYRTDNLLALGSNVQENTFDLRSGFIGTSDLVPLGGAFPKRVSELWDGNGAADAWVVSKYDDDGDGLPDWWEAMYGDADELSWDSDVVVDGRTYKAWELYLRDLAKGLLADGSFDETYSASGTDADKDGLPDWWENVYGIQGVGGDEGDALVDSDNDQLSNWAEYLVGEAFAEGGYSGFSKLDPTSMRTGAAADGQVIPDYFLPVGKLYLGEMLSDHDFMEDWWERLWSTEYVSMFVSDGLRDTDDDGWSNFAECRAGTDPTVEKSVSFVSADSAEYPIPTIRTKIHYNGNQDVQGGNLVVKAYSSSTVADKASAEWTISMSGTSSDSSSSSSSDSDGSSDIGTSYTRHLGRNPGSSVTYNLGNGQIVPGTVTVSFRDLNALDVSADGSSTWLAASGTSWCEGLKENFTGTETESAALTTLTGESVGLVNYKTGDVTIDFSKIPDYLYKVGSSTQGDSGSYVYSFSQPAESNAYERIYIPSSYVKIEWNGQMVSSDHLWSLNLTAADTGYLREGNNYFEAFFDVDGDGEWTAGEPYGCATKFPFAVGWSSGDLEFELTDTAPQTFRVNLQSAVADNTFENQTLLTDRGVNGHPRAENAASANAGTNMPATTETDVHVRLALTALNGRGGYQATAGASTVYPTLVAYDGSVNLAVNPLFTEADILKAGELDLGWGDLSAQATRLGLTLANITSATYRVVLGDGVIAAALTNNNLATLFVNKYEAGAAGAQTKCSPTSPQGIVYAAQPTFQWKHNNTIDKLYPAFRLRVWKSGTSTLVYDSGIQRAPARNSTGVYSWTAPIYAGMATPEGVVFATTNNYDWAVSMLDAKFTTVNTSETKRTFRLECSGEGGGMTDYGAIDVSVKYFGPASTSFKASALEGLVRVEAFTSPDFSGTPVGAAYLKGGVVMTSTTDNSKNCTIPGLSAGTYYVRAYIDTNGDAKKATWESWGYVNYVGTEKTGVYNPRGVEIVRGSAEKPLVVLYMEDMDTDADGFPDAYEVDQNGSLATQGPAAGNSFFTRVNPNLKTTVNAYSKLDLTASYLQSAPLASLLALTSGSLTADNIAAANMLSGEDLVKESVYVKISGFSLTDGVTLDITTEVEANNSQYIAVEDEATVGVYLVASDSLDFADALTVKVKDITINANATNLATVTAEELAKAIEENGLGDKAFFKVRLAK